MQWVSRTVKQLFGILKFCSETFIRGVMYILTSIWSYMLPSLVKNMLFMFLNEKRKKEQKEEKWGKMKQTLKSSSRILLGINTPTSICVQAQNTHLASFCLIFPFFVTFLHFSCIKHIRSKFLPSFEVCSTQMLVLHQGWLGVGKTIFGQNVYN